MEAIEEPQEAELPISDTQELTHRLSILVLQAMFERIIDPVRAKRLNLTPRRVAGQLTEKINELLTRQ